MVYPRFRCDCCSRQADGRPVAQELTAVVWSGEWRIDLGAVRLPEGWEWDGERLRCGGCVGETGRGR